MATRAKNSNNLNDFSPEMLAKFCNNFTNVSHLPLYQICQNDSTSLNKVATRAENEKINDISISAGSNSTVPHKTRYQKCTFKQFRSVG